MNEDDPVVELRGEQVALSESDQPISRTLPAQDQLRQNDSEWEKARHRWFENTKQERLLVREIRATRDKDLSRILYRAFLEGRRGKGQRLKRNFVTAWPLRPQDLQRGEYGSSPKVFLIRHVKPEMRNRSKGYAFIDLSGEQPNASPHQHAAAESSDDDDRVSDTSVTKPYGIAGSDYDSYRFKPEPDTRPAAQMEEVLSAHLTKMSKEKFRERLRNHHLLSNGYEPSSDDKLIATRLRPLVRDLIDYLNNLLSGMRYEASERKRKRRALSDWDTVMLVASQRGWPNEVIYRTTKRCETIFGSSSQCGQTSVKFLPLANTERIHQGGITRESLGHVQGLSTTEKYPQPASGNDKVSKRRHFCPVEKCQRHRVPFAQLPNLEEHMERSHSEKLT
ncbi:hypothetical protein TSTA_040630 [Talaromyces stipitatus ATCC 10500]|uniref:Uncharacterized protein n=1 Tax=Talaromyces stipitatus (strain ATCC 10500 / CBS 375.48 / QM 6759 / NRRL 1006) TaxID=441959 RepID=B8MI99_TALSN|nr:uncharacterized protein TSTA_040630 [Talaromyces stipitatus ATCC 10500]EED14583.1 hypothetical protein TSTA_040630 [Talaromyces stipitatus ATCC 10500]